MNPKDLPVDESQVRAFQQVRNTAPTPELSRTADSVLVSSTADAMAHRLGRARQEDRHSWWNPAVCSVVYLRDLLDKAVADEDWVSVCNYAAMLRMREAVDATS